jgi:hypothetical protein
VSAPNTSEYPVRGGVAEIRSFESGEGSTIELHPDGGAGVMWSSEINAPDFMGRVAKYAAPDRSARARLMPLRTMRREIPFHRAQSAIGRHESRVNLITVDTQDHGSFVWEARRPTPVAPGYPYVFGVVGVTLARVNHALLAQFVEETATSQVRQDIPGILETADRLAQNVQAAA